MTIEIKDITDPRVAMFASLTEAQLRNSKETKEGIFIAESPKVIRVAVQCGYLPIAIMCERRHIEGDAKDIISSHPGMPVYTADREILSQITGYTLTRGVLCAMRRRPLPSVENICTGARLVAILQSITDTTNIGAIFRSASAMGVDAVILSSDTCDPLNRRAIRVSMGTVFTVPWTITRDPAAELRKQQFTIAALALNDNSISLDDPRLKASERLAVMFGTEGDGLPEDTIECADLVVKIPMHHNVDSLNVAAAAAVTFWELRNYTTVNSQNP